ncbi:siderophore-interacting protein [Thaumasiovibrio subtropicus]|uniref:siderophore-interacting protein n=1 Tax=Thaumasiovibrio subtropicus TaxID=1891207 RepID=UPI000B3560A7|nr:siderophore-interacting protein [Thaumasiovibrio subtropicus]
MIVKKKPAMKPKRLIVERSERVTPYMQRITFSGEDIRQFPAESLGGYVKFMFNDGGGTHIEIRDDMPRPTLRTYTIKALDTDKARLVVDFVCHGDGGNVETSGVAGSWAMRVKPGESLFVGGPGVLQPINMDTDFKVFAADMTALPAVSVQLSKLAPETKGIAVIEVATKADVQPLVSPEGVQIVWVFADGEHALSEVVRDQVLPENPSLTVWCACEFNQMRAIRRFITDNYTLPRENTYFSSYWKEGVTEDGHKVFKREDAESLKAQS